MGAAMGVPSRPEGAPASTEGDLGEIAGAVVSDEHLTARLGKMYMIPSKEIVTTSEAQDKHLRAFEDGCQEWESYHAEAVPEEEMQIWEQFVTRLLAEHEIVTESDFNSAVKAVRRDFRVNPSKPQMARAYFRLRDQGLVDKHVAFERVVTKKAVRSNSGVVVITVVTAPGKFSCPHDCHYCPDEPGQPRSYLSTEPAVARANQNEFDPVRQFYDRADSLAKQTHTVDKVEIIVLGGTWSGYPKDYQEEFCRDLFYAANTFDEDSVKLGQRGEAAAKRRKRLSLLEEQQLNERADVKIIGLTLETRPDHITWQETQRLRRLGCTRVQIGVQHTDDEVLRTVNRGHLRRHAVDAVRMLKTCGFKVDIHIMPDLPGTTPEKDRIMFDDILFGDELQADHWKIYPCEVTPFSKLEQWHEEGTYIPYTERDPKLLTDLLAGVKSQVPPWIRLNRVIRDIPEVSIIAGNSHTNLRQAVFAELKKRGQCCHCIRCREVRDWPEPPNLLRVRVREYRSSGGTEFFISVEGGPRGLGGGATQRGLSGTDGKKVKPTKAERKEKKQRLQNGGSSTTSSTRKPTAAAVGPPAAVDIDPDNATLYGLLRLRLNDDPKAPGSAFPELVGCALIRELHVYGVLVAAREGETSCKEKPQHTGIGRTLMATAEKLAASRGWNRIAVIAGVGVRNYYRKLGYKQQGEGQYLLKDLVPRPYLAASEVEAPFLAAMDNLVALDRPWWIRRMLERPILSAAVTVVGLAGILAAVTIRKGKGGFR